MAVVVVAEDDPDLRLLFRYTLERAHHTVFDAGNGRDAFGVVLDRDPDLVLTDHAMPVMTGAQLCTELHRDARTAHIPVIMASAHIEPDQLPGLPPNVAACVSKPILPGSMRALVEEVLRAHTGVGTAPGATRTAAG